MGAPTHRGTGMVVKVVVWGQGGGGGGMGVGGGWEGTDRQTDRQTNGTDTTDR